MNNNLFRLKLEEGVKHKFYCEKYGIKQDNWSKMVKYGVSINSVVRYDLFDLIDKEQLPEWYYKIKEYGGNKNN